MKLLDLYCGAGGAAMGYHQAGFDEIIGIDTTPQPDYPFEFIEADALDPYWWSLGPFDMIHASPPCQGYTPMANRFGSKEPRLLNETRALITYGTHADQPYAIENVIGSGLDGVTLCGTSFGLNLRRHRLFETSFPVWGLHCNHPQDRDTIAVYGKPDGRRLWTRADGTKLHAWSSVKEGQEALGIDWTDDWHQIREAIPPAYTEYIGTQFLLHEAQL
ncbi:MAG: DNA cytosine methyltransferase [bacterium]|nr:DNA cytosine methyltransferase [bacterium]